MASVLTYLISFLLFFIVSSPFVYMVTRKIFGGWVATPDGRPSPAGLALHAFVYTAVAGFIMVKFRKNLRLK